MTDYPNQGNQPNFEYGQQPASYGNQPSFQPAIPQQPGYYQPILQPHPSTTAIFVLGILGLVLFAPFGLVAWIMGNKAYKEIAANPQLYTKTGLLVAGRTMGIVGFVFWIVVLVIIALFYLMILYFAVTYGDY